MLLLTLFPTPTHFQADRVQVDPLTREIRCRLHACQPTVVCPRCTQPATRRHSVYVRQVRDLPMAGYTAKLSLLVRKFFCDHRDCPQRIFVERLPAVVAPYARRTLRLATEQRHVTLEHGAEAAARTAPRQGMAVSPRTLLRLVRSRPIPVRPTPRVLGVDDFAFRRGTTYGTILVDLETHTPVDLLPDRAAATLATWRQAHPGVAIMSRDRSREYADGARRGAPAALQVADRFHLLQNLREMLQRFLDRQQTTLRTVMRTPLTVSDSEHAGGMTTHDPAVPQPPGAEGLESPVVVAATDGQLSTPPHRDVRRAARLARYEAVRTCHAQGMSIRAIAAHLQISRQTVRICVRADQFPERATPRRPFGKLAPYVPYLRAQVLEGAQNGLALWRTLRDEQGYTGSRALVSRWVAAHRHLCAHATAPASARGRGRPPVVPSDPSVRTRRLSARQAAWLLVRRPADLSERDQQIVVRLITVNADIHRLYERAQAFTAMVRTRTAAELDAWIADATAQRIPELRTFAAGLLRDHAAVVAGLSQIWSNGQTEGQINRLKLLKRSGYGRANFDLLRYRVLAQEPWVTHQECR